VTADREGNAVRLGYACINLTLGRKVRSMQLATLRARGLPFVQELLNENLAMLTDILAWNQEHGIDMFRLTSDLVPFGSHEEVDVAQLDFSLAVAVPSLAAGMRLSTHPGQFTVISSAGTVWENSLTELLYQSELMDILGIDGDIVIHGGGVYGQREETATRIAEHIETLSQPLRGRLRLENDERSWSVDHLLPICERTGTPLIVDNLHHVINGSRPLAELPWARIGATWGGRLPKLHYSEQDPSKRPGAHSEYLTADLFRRFRDAVGLEDYDVMLESKGKELALLRLREELVGLAC